MKRTQLTLAGTALVLASQAAAQDRTDRTAPPPMWPVPLHDATDPTDGSHAHWAAGPDYKVRFDDGMTFFPVLGDRAPRNLPVRWTTERIDIGGARTVAFDHSAVEVAIDDFTYRRSFEGVTEQYDIRSEGVEQRFIISERPQSHIARDLVVVGHFESELEAQPLNEQHAALTFRDARGTPIVTYGEALAIDARGDTVAMTTTHHHGEVELRAPAAWLARAEWPIVVDPLTSRVRSSPYGIDPAQHPDVVRDDANNNHLVVYSRASSASDADVFVRLRNDDLSELANIYTDFTATDIRYTSAGYVRAPDRFAIAMEVRTPTASHIRLYFHDGGNLGFKSGTELTVAVPPGIHDSRPTVGGAERGNLGYLAFRRDAGPFPIDTARSRVIGMTIDAANATVTTPQTLHTLGLTNFDAAHPQINRTTDDSGWLVVWQELNFDNANDDWDLVSQRLDGSGARLGAAVLGPSGGGHHKLTPMVAGADGRFAVAFLVRTNHGPTAATVGDQLLMQRVDWQDTANTPTLGWTGIVEMAATDQNVLELGLTNRPLAHDIDTRSHWAVAWHRTDADDLRIARIGYDGDITEQHVLDTSNGAARTYSPSVAFDCDQDRFTAVYASDGVLSGEPLLARQLTYSNGSPVRYGTSCSGVATARTALGETAQPRAGSEFFGLTLLNGRANATTWLLASPGAGNTPIPGAPGCAILLDLSTAPIVVSATIASGRGNAHVPVPLPSTVHGVDAYWQFLQLDGGALSSSRAVRTLID